MVFSTLQFAAFFAVVLSLSWMLMPWPRLWKPFIIAASYVFYAAADVHFIVLLAFCTLWNQLFAVLIAARQESGHRPRLLLTLALMGNLGLLGYFKYYSFFAANVQAFTGHFGLPMPLPLIQVLVPVAISFYVFMAMSYVLDVWRAIQRPVAFIDFAVYLSFFPHLVAGPIVRVRELVPQFASPRDPRRIEMARAFELIAGGLIKKVFIADVLARQLVDPVFGSPTLHSRLDIVAAVYAYAVQIYCDFSAYSDIAIGAALLLGFQFPQNFNRPYAALTLQDFWHRWHMSLSRWLRDYLYIGLGGNRKGRLKTYRNLFLTMLLGGLWHGAAWKFVLWGGMHGTGLAVERWWTERRGTDRPRVPLLRWLLTFNIVCLAWVFFRADNLSTVSAMWNQLQVNDGMTTVTWPIGFCMAAGLLLQFLPPAFGGYVRLGFAGLASPLQAVAASAGLVVVLAMIAGQGVAPFIYFRF